MEVRAMEKTFLMIKPDGVQRGLVGEVIRRLERKGIKLIGLRMLQMDRETATRLYKVHEGKGFFEDLINYVTSGPVVVMALEGERVVEIVRTLIGNTKSYEALPGTIRGDFGMTIGRNVVHASDSVENAAKELAIFFDEKDFLSYTRIDETWLYE